MENDSKVGVIVIAWEKFRLVYNGALLVLGILLLAFYAELQMTIGDLSVALGVVAVAVMANRCFFIGPVAEIYSLVFLDWEWPNVQRNSLFGIGLVFSCLLFIAMVSATAFTALPNQ